MQVCKQHHDEVAAGTTKSHVTDTVIGIEQLFKFAAIPGCVLQPVRGNPASVRHGEGCIKMKKHYYSFGLNPHESFTTSNQCDIVIFLGDSGGSLTKELPSPCMDKVQLAANNLHLAHLFKAEMPEISGALVAVHPNWGVTHFVKWLEDTFGVAALSIK